MARRLQLHEELCTILGTRKVYFQPPASVKLEYDCIIYSISTRNDLIADNRRYRDLVRYEVMVVYRDPDSDIPDRLLDHFSRISHERHYTVDNLHHDIFTLYY